MRETLNRERRRLQEDWAMPASTRIRGSSSPRSARRRHRRRREKSPSVAVTASQSLVTRPAGAATRRDSVTYSASGHGPAASRVAAALLFEVARTPHDIPAESLCQQNGVRGCDRHDRGLVRRDRIWHERQRSGGAPRTRGDVVARWRTPRLRGLCSTTLAEQTISDDGLTVGRARQVVGHARASCEAPRCGTQPDSAKNSVAFPRTVVG